MSKDSNFNLRKHLKKEVREKEKRDKEWKVDATLGELLTSDTHPRFMDIVRLIKRK